MPHVLEVAEICVTDPVLFEKAVAQSRQYFLAAEGCLSVSLHRIVETSDVYRLLVKWRCIDDHLVTFRSSDYYQKWRELASPFFAKPPTVTHSTEIELN